MLSMLPESPQIPTHFACRSSCHSASITCGFAPSCAKLDTALTAQCPEVVRHLRGFRHRRLADAHGARWEKACTGGHAPLPSRRSPERRLDLHTTPPVHG